MTNATIPRILIIAGSDSGGGAGVQADIKTVTMLGGYAMTAITAITAQNTLGVTAVHPVPAETVLAQIDAVVDDIGIDAVKIGMIGSAFTANVVADRLEALEPKVPIVFDPVMVSTSGAALADDATVAAFARLMDIATISTPNLPELQRLTGKEDPVEAALALVGAHGCAVMIKGGHDEGDALADALIEEDNITSWQGSRIDTPHTHGTGCTLASAIAVGLAQGHGLPTAIAAAREFVRMALHEAPGLGQGHGPMGHGKVRLDVGGGPRLNQVTLTGKDYAKSVAFYRKLGLKQIVDSPENGYARFESWGGGSLSIQIDPEEEVGPTTAIYLECDDLDARVEQLARTGLPFEHGPRNQPWMWREARLRDPSGNIVFLYKAGEHRRYPPWRMADEEAPAKIDEPSPEPHFDSFEVKRAVLP